MEITRVFDILELYKAKYKKDDILSAKENKQWKKYSSDDLIRHSNLVSYGLLALGLTDKDKVAIISNNRPEWNFCDFGCQQANIVTVPVFPTISNTDLNFILNHAEVKAIFISDKAIYTKLVAIEKEIPLVKHIISFNPIEGVMSFNDFLELGKQNEAEEKVNAIKNSIFPSHLLTILYTSGTTGTPKGVMISHHNLVSNILAVQDFAPFESWWKALSFLPLNHVYERMVCTLYLYKGISVYYAEGLETIGDNLKEIKPQIFVSVPRLIERVYEKITATGEKLTGTKRKIFDWSMNLAHRYELNNKNGWWYNLQHKIADKLVFSKWRAAVGGELVCIASGGAALNPKLERIFLCANIICLQGYGLTETCVVVSVNHFGEDNIRIGTCGPVIDSVSVKIAEEDGEILVKGPNVMLGYYKNPEATAEVMDSEGWFHTGDVGTFVDDRFLKITDRKKEIFKTSAGKYIAPLMIENKLKECRYIEQSMIVGENQKFASAVIVPSFANFKEYCKDNGIVWTTNEEMSKHDDLKRIINDHVKNMNKSLAPYEQLKRVAILSKEWSIEGGELTPKMSLKRKVIKEKNAEAIYKIFAVED
ncbi:MAG: AMP-dependent synthetase [Bacteroidota bacterium]|jgi:long-chain acyl-CoA synthetase|nr:AMP-dependent synthetase [Bacteroidota bacterium]